MRWLLPVLIACGALIRLYQLDFACLWLDETSSLSDSDTLRAAFTKVFHPPLYFVSLHFWRSLFGDSDFAVRSLSVAFSCGNVCLVYALALDIFKNKRTAGLAALIYIIIPRAAYMDREARMYCLFACLILVTTWGFSGLVQGDVRRRRIAAYLGGFFAALATHYYAAMYIAPMALALFWTAFRGRSLTLKRVLVIHSPIALSGIAAIAAVIVVLGKSPLDYMNSYTMTVAYDFSKPFSAAIYMFNLEMLIDMENTPLVIACGVAIYLLFAKGASFAKPHGWPLLFAILAPMILINTLPVRNHAYRYWYPTYVTCTALLAGALVGLWKARGSVEAVSRAKSFWAFRVLAVSVVVAFVCALPSGMDRLYSEKKEPWREALLHIKMQEQPGDVIVTYSPNFVRSVHRYYDGKLQALPFEGYFTQSFAEVLQHKRVWLIYGYASLDQPRLPDFLTDKRMLLLRKKYPRFQVFLFGDEKEMPALSKGSAPEHERAESEL